MVSAIPIWESPCGVMANVQDYNIIAVSSNSSHTNTSTFRLIPEEKL